MSECLSSKRLGKCGHSRTWRECKRVRNRTAASVRLLKHRPRARMSRTLRTFTQGSHFCRNERPRGPQSQKQMKNILLSSIIAIALAGGASTAQAKHKDKHHDHDDHWSHDHGDRYGHSYRGSTRSIYVIERNRPVQRVVYVEPGGRYYRWVDGRRVYVTGRYYTSYPSRYYYADGRPRVGVSIHF